MSSTQRLQMPLIIPPFEVRGVIDKTAEYVAKNGSQYEEVIHNNTKDNAMFSFLKITDPYRAYYDKRVIELSKKSILDLEAQDKLVQDHSKDLIEVIKQEPIINESYEYRFTFPTPSMTMLENELIKLTAFYVASGDEGFLDRISEKEAQNPTFSFLKPTHGHFLYFTNLVESYLKIRDFNKQDFERLYSDSQSKSSIIDRCTRRQNLEKDEIKEKRQLVQDTNKLEDNQDFDWNNFVIVETIDLDLAQFHVGKTDSRGTFHAVDPKNFLGKKGIDPEFAFLAEGLKTKKVSGVEQNAPKFEEIDVEKPTISFKPNQSDEAHYKCTFCGESIPVSMFESHNQMELKNVQKKVSQPYKTKDFGEVDYDANLRKMIEKRTEMRDVKTKEDSDEDLFKKKELVEVAKPKLLSKK